jgi:hypothetical protein
VTAQGWYRDPYGVHEARYFSAGHPTKLVRDGDVEAYDALPPGPPREQLVEVSGSQAADGSDLLRADADQADLPYDRKKAFWAAVDSAAVFGPLS